MAKNCQSPDTFYPERYLEDPELPDPHSFVFGFGRRYVLKSINHHVLPYVSDVFAFFGVEYAPGDILPILVSGWLPLI